MMIKKTLNQNEIDALFAKAQAPNAGVNRSPSKKVVPCDLRRSNKLATDQVVAVTTLHESLARRLSSSLSAHFRVAIEVNLVSIEQLAYREFIARLPDLTYFASMQVLPIDVQAAIQLDIALAYPIIDVVLGGSGTDPIDSRDLTEIEEQLLETVILVILQDLQSTWAPVLNVEFRFQKRQRNVQMHSVMLPEEKTLCLSFETRFAEASGTLALAFPAVVANALLRKLSAQWSYSERTPSRESGLRTRERLLDSRFLADLSLPNNPLAIKQLVHLEPGHVLALPKSAREPIHLNIAGKPMFLAYPVRQGTRRSARIERRIPIASPSTKEQG